MIAILAMAAMTNIDGSRMKATQDVGSRGDVLLAGRSIREKTDEHN
jgi:hypothetical protein